MKKAAVDLLLLAQREKYLSLLRQVLPALEIGCDAAEYEANMFHVSMAGYKPDEHKRLDEEHKKIRDALQAVREALK